MDVASLLLSVAPFLIQAGRRFARTPPAKQAAHLAAQDFEKRALTEQALLDWLQGDDFARLVEQLGEGEEDLVQSEVVGTFIEATHWLTSDDYDEAESILASFLRHYNDQLLRQEGSHVLMDARAAARNERLTAELMSMGDKVDQVASVIAAVQPALVLSAAASDSGPEEESRAPGGDDAVTGRLDAARTLLRQGRPQSAGALLDEIERHVAEGRLSREQRFRQFSYLGAAALQLDRPEEAADHFRAALSLKPDDAGAQANLAVALLNGGDPEGALALAERAFSASGEDERTGYVYVLALSSAGRDSEIDGVVAAHPWLALLGQTALGLCQVEVGRERYEAALGYADTAVAQMPKEPEAHIWRALARLLPVQDQLRRELPLAWRVPDQLREAMQQVLADLDAAIQLLEVREAGSRKLVARIHRASVRGMLGDYSEAEEDCRAVLAEDKSNINALHTLAHVYADQARWADAAGVLSQEQELAPSATAALALGQAYCRLGQHSDAVALLEPLWDPDSRDPAQVDVAALLLEAYGATRKEMDEQVSAILESLATTWADDPRATVAVAHWSVTVGDLATAAATVEDALGQGTEHGRDILKLELADLRYGLGEFAAAASLYDGVVDDTEDNSSFRRLVISRYETGDYERALQHCRQARSRHFASSLYGEIEASILAFIGDFRGSVSVLLDLDTAADSSRYKAKAGLLLLRLGEGARAAQLAEDCSTRHLEDDPDALMELAGLRSALGLGEALAPAYEARRLKPKEARLHLQYIAVFLARGDDEVLEVQQVGPGSAVRLERDNQIRTFVILEDGVLARSTTELEPGEPLREKLIGRSVGDEIVLRDEIEDLRYIVAEIQNKYVFAFQESLRDFSTQFPEDKSLFRVEMPDESLDPFLHLLDRAYERETLVLGQYREGVLTLGTVGKLLGLAVVETWALMTGVSEGRIVASSGDAEEFERRRIQISKANVVVLDETAVLTLDRLGLLVSVTEHLDNLVVAQATLDDIEDVVQRRFGRPAPGMSVGKTEDGYYRQELTDSEIEEGRRRLEALEQVLREKAEPKPITMALKVGKGRFDELTDVLGEPAAASMLLAAEPDVLLVTDDYRLAILARAEYSVDSANTQALLSHLVSEGVLTTEDYLTAVASMAALRFSGLFVTADDVVQSLKVHGMALSQESIRLMGVVGEPVGNLPAKAEAVYTIARSIALDPLLPERRRKWLLSSLIQLAARGPVGGIVLPGVRSLVASRLRLAPAAQSLILSVLDDWMPGLHLYQ